MPDFRTKLDRPLSPAAQAVFDAGDIGFATHREMIAAALRAAADQVVPFEPLKGCDQDALQRDETRNQLLAIANELDPQ
jgi:hypothetical protein